MNDKTNNPTGVNPYDDTDGGEAIRMLTPCDDGQCGWQEGGAALTMSVGCIRYISGEMDLMDYRGSGGIRLLKG